MRDYLKNDWDIYACPDGWFRKADFLGKWGGTYGVTYFGPNDASSWETSNALYSGRTGYLWLPHRALTRPSASADGICAVSGFDDTPGEIAKTASDLPGLLVLADFAYGQGRWYNRCPGTFGSGAGSDGSGCGLGSNHIASSYKQLPLWATNCAPSIYPPNIGREEDPLVMPLGSNRVRIDARTTWKAFQDWRHFRWSTGYHWHSF